jgi:hypothetical protein
VARNVTGNRHEINYEYMVAKGQTWVRATCICGGLDAPAHFGKERADEDGHQHLVSFSQQLMSRGKRGK